MVCPLAARRSCFGIRLALADGNGLPPRCIRHRRRSKAKPLRGSRGGYRRKPQNFQRRQAAIKPAPARSASPDSTLKYALCPPQGALIRLFPFYTYFKGAGLHQPAPLLCTKMRAFWDLQVDKCAYSCHNLIKIKQRRVRREVQLRRFGVRQPGGRP